MWTSPQHRNYLLFSRSVWVLLVLQESQLNVPMCGRCGKRRSLKIRPPTRPGIELRASWQSEVLPTEVTSHTQDTDAGTANTFIGFNFVPKQKCFTAEDPFKIVTNLVPWVGVTHKSCNSDCCLALHAGGTGTREEQKHTSLSETWRKNDCACVR